jgi:hypothetical protein
MGIKSFYGAAEIPILWSFPGQFELPLLQARPHALISRASLTGRIASPAAENERFALAWSLLLTSGASPIAKLI